MAVTVGIVVYGVIRATTIATDGFHAAEVLRQLWGAGPGRCPEDLEPLKFQDRQPMESKVGSGKGGKARPGEIR